MREGKNIIELQHVKKCYEKDMAVVEDFSLEIKKGEFVTFLGPSGCGKTTILRMIGGFELPTEGRILLHGEDITKLPPHQRPVNTVFQKYALFPYLNIYDNIAFGLKMKKLPKEVIRQKVKRVLEIVDLEGFEKRKVDTLSGGQQQRVAIARAMALTPDILCFDEPTSALDPELTGEVLRVIRNLKQKNYTMIIVTHDMAFAKSISDVVIYMADGVIEETGTPAQVFDAPKSERARNFLKGMQEEP